MLELRKLDLQLAFAALRASRKDVEDQRRAVENPQIERALEVALLRGRQRNIENHEAGVGRKRLRLYLLDLAGADVVRGIGALAANRYVPDRHDAGRFDQQFQFVRRLGIVPAADRHADQKGARGPLRALGFNLEDGQVSDSAVRVTGRAGTTVEMACL